MCTLILGLEVMGPGTLLLAANRDEDPRRPSEPPRVLRESPRVVGGRDAVAGGTWLAIRERSAVVAMLNRRWNGAPPETPDPRRRSRGLLAIDVAAVPLRTPEEDLAATALEQARTRLERDVYEPFSLVFATRQDGWLLVHEPNRPARVTPLAKGWHVLTHADLDDRNEPRTAWLLDRLAGSRPAGFDRAGQALLELLSAHGREGPPAEPAVCLHTGRMVTVSSTILTLGERDVHYLHVEGRPCERPPLDVTDLLVAPARS